MYQEIVSATNALNLSLFATINAGPDLGGLSLVVALFCAVQLIFLIPSTLIMLWLKGNEVYRHLAIKALAMTSLGLCVNYVLGSLFYHGRPFVAGVGNSYLQHSASSSFPSSHGTIMFTVALIFGACRVSAIRRLGLALLMPALLVAWARVFVGVHWPLDMMGALCLAGLLTVLANTVMADRVTEKITHTSVYMYRTLFAKFIARGWLAA